MAAASLASEKIVEAKHFLEKLNCLLDVEGVNKLKKRIKAEINFLSKALKTGNELKEEHIMCSNLGQLGALCDAAVQASEVVGVLQNFSSRQFEKIVVDVVADNGKQWIKVILRCPKALHILYVMGGRRGVRPLNEVAEEFLAIANEHPVFYSVPQIVFWFFRGVSGSLASALEKLGVLVKGTVIPDEQLDIPDFTVEDSDSESEDLSDKREDCGFIHDDISNEKYNESNAYDDCERTGICSCDPSGRVCEEKHTNKRMSSISNDDDHIKKCNCNVSQPAEDSESSHGPHANIRKLNLDVTALIAYVSATANGGANFIFSDKILTEQAMWERSNPVKSTLEKYFAGGELLMCQEAVDHLNEIIQTIGGSSEKKRACDILERVTIVPGQDIYENELKIGGKVRKLSRIIFGTGQAHKAITVTSNRGFVRSAEQQGIKPVVLYHDPRALTEKKETTAIPCKSL